MYCILAVWGDVLYGRLVTQIVHVMVNTIIIILIQAIMSYSEQSIVLNDPPCRIDDSETMSKLPHRLIGSLRFLDGDYHYPNAGTAFLISKNLLLTAAHNLFKKKLGCPGLGSQNLSFKFYLKANGTALSKIPQPNQDPKPNSTIFSVIKGFKYPKQYKECLEMEKIQYDYAVIKLQTPVEQNQLLQLAIPCPTCIEQQNEKTMVKIYGYPYCEQNYQSVDLQGRQFKLKQYGLSRQYRINSINPKVFKICYAISTVKGHSGSPVVFGDKIIAVHVGGEQESSKVPPKFNTGRLIDIKLIYNLNQWCKQLGAQPFKVNQQFCVHLTQDLSEYFKVMNITQLSLPKSKLKDINLQKYIGLKDLSLPYNSIDKINITQNIHLETIQLSYNVLKTIDLSKNIQLTKMDFQCNKIESIDLTKNLNLRRIWLNSNQLKQIELLGKINPCFGVVQKVPLSKLIQVQLDYNRLNKMEIYYFNAIPYKDFIFDDQRSTICNVALLHNDNQIEGCIVMKDRLTALYAIGGHHNHNKCNYIFQAKHL